MQNLKFLFIPLISTSLLLVACATEEKVDNYAKLEATTIYQSGIKNLKKQYYKEAVDDFEGLEAHYPFGEYTDKSQLGEIYGHYKQGEYPETMAAAERFIQVHPRHPHVDYAHYMKGLAHFAESVGFVAKYLPMERSERDCKAAEEATADFTILVEQFPNSRYVPDSKKRLLYLYNVVAENELHAARHYLKRKAYIAAINRASTIIERFPQSTVTEEALVIQVKAYRELDLCDLAKDSLHVLTLNYPNSSYIRTLS